MKKAAEGIRSGGLLLYLLYSRVRALYVNILYYLISYCNLDYKKEK